MLRSLFALIAILVALPCAAQDLSYPASFTTQDIATNGTTIHVRVGGKGPAILLLHGYGETGDMWVPMAVEFARKHTVVVPDLRGMGLSSKPAGGFDKKTQAVDMAGVLGALKIDRADVVAHDIGNMVAYAFAAQFPDRVRKLVLIDAPVPGIGPWDEIIKPPLLWHFRFADPIWNASSRDASASILIASGTILQRLRPVFRMRRASIMRSSMLLWGGCTRASHNLRRSIRM